MTDINALLDQMTLEEQVSLLSGADFWSVPAIERLGIGTVAGHGWAERGAGRRVVGGRRQVGGVSGGDCDRVVVEP